MTNMTKQFALALALAVGLASAAVAKNETAGSKHNSGSSRAIQTEQVLLGSFSSTESAAAVEERWFDRASGNNS